MSMARPLHVHGTERSSEPLADVLRGLAGMGESQVQLHTADYRRPGPKVRLPERPTGLDAGWDWAASRLAYAVPRQAKVLQLAHRVLACRAPFEALSDEVFRGRIAEVREDFRRGRVSPQRYIEGLALAVEAGRRSLGLTAYRVQVAGAIVLGRGQIAEMATGEGKTLTAALAACLVAWRGRGCHVVTVNDYLAQRDADWARPLYQACGLTVDALQEGMEPPQRHEAYHASVTYATQKELAADFLRDSIMAGEVASGTARLIRRLSAQSSATSGGSSGATSGAGGTSGGGGRGLYFALVDEADSVLIDEAVTPLILAGETNDREREAAFNQACELAADLQVGVHYRVQLEHRDIRFTSRGEALLDKLTDGLAGLWRIDRIRRELAKQAVVAKEHYLRDRDYIIEEGKIVIVDASTGRRMPDRSWQQGMHQAVETKEQLELTPVKQTLARVSFQRFFRLYEQLSGLTGTAWEVRHELWRTYRTPVVPIPRHRPLQRRVQPFRVLDTTDAKHHAIVEATVISHREGRPVLIGTASVDESQRIAELLEDRVLQARVLNAVHHQTEAEIVAEAGQPGAITVATNMAGRGTDIKLPPEVVKQGGLHVIAALRNGSARVDRQLIGRCARQGEPGLATVFASWDDELVQRYLPKPLRRRCRKLPSKYWSLVFRWVQHRSDRAALRQRNNVQRYDDWLNQSLGFARDVT